MSRLRPMTQSRQEQLIEQRMDETGCTRDEALEYVLDQYADYAEMKWQEYRDRDI